MFKLIVFMHFYFIAARIYE